MGGDLGVKEAIGKRNGTRFHSKMSSRPKLGEKSGRR